MLEANEESTYLDDPTGPYSVACEDLEVSIWEQKLPTYVHYIDGIFEYLDHGDFYIYSRYLDETLNHFGSYLGLPAYGVSNEAYIEGTFNDTVKDEMAEFVWKLGFGIPHPRGLTGCAFMTSWELTVIFGFSLCDVGHHRSLRGVCPISCGCLFSNNSGVECPAACAYTR